MVRLRDPAQAPRLLVMTSTVALLPAWMMTTAGERESAKAEGRMVTVIAAEFEGRMLPLPA